MNPAMLKDQLWDALEFPFAAEAVVEVTFNCGTVWITLQSGQTYFVQVVECENDES